MAFQLEDGSLSTEYKVGDMFKVSDDYIHGEFKAGDIVRLVEDDNSSCPLFILVNGDDSHWYESWSYLTPFEQEFTREDLKDGMVVTYRDGQKRFLLDDYLIVKEKKGVYVSNQVSNYKADLKYYKYNDEPDLDIMKVEYMGNLVWERPEEKTKEQKRIEELEAVIAKAQQELNNI